jgi:hypothetical protein
VLPTIKLLDEIERQPKTFSYKMLLLIEMAELADSAGRVPLRSLAERFREFFVAFLRERGGSQPKPR